MKRVILQTTLEKYATDKRHIAEEVDNLKQQPGKDLVIFGSPGLAANFLNMGLIDEYKLTIHLLYSAMGSVCSVTTLQKAG